MTDLIVIPARYGSKRFPGKPLMEIAGHSLVSRVIDVARQAAMRLHDVDVVVATDDDRIVDHVEALGAQAVMTSSDISSGTGRALAAARSRASAPGHVVNLQGDAPFVPVEVVCQMMEAARAGGDVVVTPVVPLSWEDLDVLREHKKAAPFSGTTCIRGPGDRALWFSKSILPAIRDEAKYRASTAVSPVLRHIGLYAYSLNALERFEAAPESLYETLEGLEQLRFFALEIPVQTVEIAPPRISMSGIDTPEDAALAEQMIARLGDPYVGALETPA
ncbi:3-deoxy-manno-octulosonate cytidylyltransferase (CMP-KDO synthetase) [Sphingobium fontiphilum]|uniref:3-deoxy-manno-octulosonate cytidylyltransferase (CMP-KDO synthetase) n=1 Tax=Sphingobium fontiphilum TaxID=944425 RepID=A0A7W6GMJ4_9SPHN|nr:3-deoxy-manno-octulosonate cytidylyltransferase [Sphingobium fontiphilum]MBB3980537.1 3-deoxy-manno-octulosonate cytidylyltransferase (CMP-KDO synthetase) [Sphingobium fontiphilum]